MSDNTSAPETAKPAPRYPVERNGQVVFFSPVLKKGGDEEFMMVVPETTLQELTNFLGQEDTKDIIMSKLRPVLQEVSRAATNKNNDFSLEAFKVEIANLSARTESIPSLKEKKDKLVARMQELIEGDVSPESMASIKELSAQIRGINTSIENRKRQPAVKEEND